MAGLSTRLLSLLWLAEWKVAAPLVHLDQISNPGRRKIWGWCSLETWLDLITLPLRPIGNCGAAGGVPCLWLSGALYKVLFSWFHEYQKHISKHISNIQDLQDFLSDLGSYLGLLLGWYNHFQNIHSLSCCLTRVQNVSPKVVLFSPCWLYLRLSHLDWEATLQIALKHIF